jgi:RNA polymerase sigma-70 factor (ECF subfamily)
MDIAGLFAAYKTDVFRFALSFVRDTSLAEDVTSDVFVALMENRERISRSKVKSWLMSCTKNTALNLLRKRSHEVGEISDVQTGQASSSDVYECEFFAMLEVLDDIDRQIVTLHTVNGLKHNETARVLELKPGTVRQRYARALKTLRESIESI